jgi:hypothetical protein
MFELVRVDRYIGQRAYTTVGTYATADEAGLAIDLLCARPAPAGTIGWQVVDQATGERVVDVRVA